MEINYNLIIKYLSKANNENKFITKKNIFNYANTFPDKFQNYLSDKYYRLGITVHDKSNNNISFWSSLLTLIDKEFNSNFNSNEVQIINQYKNDILDNFTVSKNPINKQYKLFTDKIVLRDKLNKEPDFELLEYIINYIDINFLIFDFKSNNMYTVYSGLKMNPYKSIFMFAKYNNYWEPIMIIKDKINIQKYFNYNDNVIKKILDSTDISYYENHKEYSIMTFQEVIKLEKNNLCKKDPKYKEPIEDIFVNPTEIKDDYKLLNKTKLTKMKMEEINKLIEELKIELPEKKPIKSGLVELILAKIKE